MKVSIITPTNDTRFLNELKESIEAQTYKDWEWVIVPNNGAKVKFEDEKIKIIPYFGKSKNIGAFKKFGFQKATGEILVEVDHDDLLTPDALEEIVKAFQDPEIGFVFSNNAKLGNFTPYDKQYGWTYKMFDWKGKKLFAMDSLPLVPGRIGLIWYAPDHVRAWRKDVYNQAGGHNEELYVCDDQDLMYKTYMISKFHFIPKVLYIYRIRQDGSNTWLKRNKEIQHTTVLMFLQNIENLASRFSDINGLMKIDLCGGINKAKGYISIDIKNGDIEADLNKGIPLDDNSVGIIRAYDALEHLQDKMLTMKEIHRVLAPGGILLSMTPSTDGRGAFQDPTHVSFWNQNSFWYWTKEDQRKFIGNNDVNFFELFSRTYFPNKWYEEHNISYVQAILEKE